jgi:ribosomal protein RSM22 (predicted rRNA methylase)
VVLIEQPQDIPLRVRHLNEYYQIPAKGIAATMEKVLLPPNVRVFIDRRAEAVGFTALKTAAAELSAAYREGKPSRVAEEQRVAAYLVTRMPATYAAAYMVLEEVRERIGDVATILDVGAGTGAASLAARAFWPGARLTLIERDRALADAAREILPDAEILLRDVKQIAPFPPAELIIAAYAIGEFGEPAAARMWQAAGKAFAAIEPGTPKGFALIRRLRDLGGSIAAPCPGNVPCPMADPDWCHFAARVERSSLHRRVKDGALGYEDEKFSYVVLSKQPVEVARARILRRPEQNPGLIVLQTCTAQGLKTERVTRRDKDAFRAARHARWGDTI